MGCKYHLGIDINRAGSIVLNRPGGGHRPAFARKAAQKHFDTWVETAIAEIQSMPETCALDVVEQYGEQGLSDIARKIGVTREMVRQLERGAARSFVSQGVNVNGLDLVERLKELALGPN